MRFAAQRVIYIDTDIVILGDLAELHDMNLAGHSCAAVQYCGQRLGDFVDFAVLAELGFKGVYDPESCIANRGVLVIDLPTWRRCACIGARCEMDTERLLEVEVKRQAPRDRSLNPQ